MGVKAAVVYHSETGNTKRQAELVAEGLGAVKGVDEVRMMTVGDYDGAFLASAQIVVLGSPTYEGTCSWQMKRFLDTVKGDLAGKLGGVFCSQNWPGGGGASFAEMSIIAGMLVRGMLVYSGGITVGRPFLHFGAVSTREPEGFDADRARKLGENLGRMGITLFG